MSMWLGPFSNSAYILVPRVYFTHPVETRYADGSVLSATGSILSRPVG